MGKQSNKTTTTSKTVYGNTTTSNPYATATTNNSGTKAAFQPGTALETVYNFVNQNIGSMLDDYLNPNLNSATNQAKLNSFQNTLNSTSRNNLENNIINPLSKRNMVRSSQAADLYKNLSNQNNASLENYINDLLGSAQNQTASMLNNLMQMYLQGNNVLSGLQSQSLQTSSGNATRTNTTAQNNGGPDYQTLLTLAKIIAQTAV